MKKDAVIDIDGHVTMECVDNWTRYFKPADGEFMESLIVNNPGRYWSSGQTKEAVYAGLKARNKSTGGWDPKARLVDMDSEGIDVAVLFGTEMTLNQEHYSPDVCRGYNNWLYDYCSADPDRLKGISLLPLGDIEAAIVEMNRTLKEFGFVGVLMKPSMEDKITDDPMFEPLYAEAERLSVPVNVHIPHRVRFMLRKQFPRYDYIRVHAFGSPASCMLAMMDMVFGGVLDRHPNLRVAYLEGGVSWLPYWLDRIDNEYHGRPGDLPAIDKPPSEYLTSGNIFFGCDPDEKHLAYATNTVGEDLIVWASDYPHSDSIFPGAVKAFLDQEGLTKEQKRKVLTENPVALLTGKRPSDSS